MSEAIAIALIVVIAVAVFIVLCVSGDPISREIEEEARTSIEDYFRRERERKALMERTLQKYLGEDE
jgi:uncharacterized protein (UPF0297 family)